MPDFPRGPRPFDPKNDLFPDITPPTVKQLEAMVVPNLKDTPGLWDVVKKFSLRAADDPLVIFAKSKIEKHSDDQTRALRSVSAFLRCEAPDMPKVFTIAGYAGVGKTTILGAIAEWSDKQHLPVRLAALSNSAVDTARKRNPSVFTQLNSQTLHSALYGAPSHGEFSIGSPRKLALEGAKVVILDEASLVPGDVMRDLLGVVKRRGIKLIIFGDPFQLGPVERPGERPFLPLEIPTFTMREVVRQKGGSPILDLATAIRTDEKFYLPKDNLPQDLPGPQTDGAWFYKGDTDRTIVLHEKLWKRNPGGIVVIVGGNKERIEHNAQIRERLYGTNPQHVYVGEPLIVIGNVRSYSNGMMIRAGDWAKGAEITELTLDREDKVRRKTIQERVILIKTKEIDPNTGKPLTFALFPDTLASSINLVSLLESQNVSAEEKKRLNALFEGAIPLAYGYAMTCHKSQGLDWPEVIVAPSGIPRELRNDSLKLARWIYTAVTRAKNRVFVADDRKFSG